MEYITRKVMYGYEKERKSLNDKFDLILVKDRALDDSEKGFHYRWLVYTYNKQTEEYTIIFKNIDKKKSTDFYKNFIEK